MQRLTLSNRYRHGNIVLLLRRGRARRSIPLYMQSHFARRLL